MPKIQFELSERDFATLETDLMVINTTLKHRITSVDNYCKAIIHKVAEARATSMNKAVKEMGI